MNGAVMAKEEGIAIVGRAEEISLVNSHCMS